MEAVFQKFFAIECGVLGALSMLYAAAVLLGWKYARPRRWWNWEPAKARMRKQVPFAIVMGALLLEVAGWPFQENWEPNFPLWLGWLAAFIVSVIFVCSGNKKFAALAREHGVLYLPNKAERALRTAAPFLLLASNIFHKVDWLQGVLLQLMLLLLLISGWIDYFAPANQSP